MSSKDPFPEQAVQVVDTGPEHELVVHVNPVPGQYVFVLCLLLVTVSVPSVTVIYHQYVV